MTDLTDLEFEPQTFRDYVQADVRKKSLFYQSGAVAVSDLVVPTYGKTVTVPAWNGLGGEAEVLSDTVALAPTKLTSSAQVAPILERGKLYTYNDLVATFTNSDPFGALAQKLGTFWAREYDRVLVNVAVGSAGGMDALDAGSVINASGAALSSASIIGTRGLFGEYQDDDLIMVVHPNTFAALQANELTDLIPGADGRVIQSFQGMQVVMSSTLPVASGSYTSMIVRPSAFLEAHDDRPQRMFESDRDIKAGNDFFTSRDRFVIHPVGAAYSDVPAGDTASNAELADAANWGLGAESVDDFGVRVLTHTL